jgi:hypothetical protein
MTSNGWWKGVVSVAVLATVVSLGFYLHFGSSVSTERRSRFPKAPSAFEGDFWMGWNHTERINFLRGMIIGYDDGYNKACTEAESITGEKQKEGTLAQDVYDECLKGQLRFLTSLENYEKVMTEFYSQYPGDRDLPLDRFVLMLSGPDHKTPEQIHQWLAAMTHQTL